MWLNDSVVSRIARGPGFESRSGHDFFLPCDTKVLAKLFLGFSIISDFKTRNVIIWHRFIKELEGT